MDLFEMLLEKYEEIDYIYKRLFNIECNGYKSSDLFSKTVKSLKEKLVQEEKIFNEIVDTYDYEDIKDKMELYYDKEAFCLRMKDRLIFHEITNYKEEIDDDEEILEMKELNKNTVLVYDVFSKNLFMLYAYFLDMTIDKLIVNNIKTKLLSVKYYNCLVKRNLEKAFVGCDFVFPKEVYSDLDFMTFLVNKDISFTRGVILDGYITSINNTLERLLCNTDDEYSNNHVLLASSINFQCLLKANFAMMSEFDYCILEDQIIEKIKELGNEDNLGMIENIADIVNNRNEYRSKIKKLSLRPFK